MADRTLYIGRVGALAVALGVGLAMANSPCVASAHEGDDHTDSATTSEPSGTSAGQTGTGTTTSAGGPTAGTATGAGTGTAGSQTPTGSTSTIGGTSVPAVDQASTGSGTVQEPHIPDPPAGTSDGDESPQRHRNPRQTRPRITAATGGGATASPKTNPPASGTSTSTSATPSGPSPKIIQAPASPPAQTTSATTKQTVALSSGTPSATGQPISQPLAATPAAQTPATLVSKLITGVLAFVGLAPNASNSPTLPTDSPPLLALLAAARRESEQTVSANAPANVKTEVQTSQPIALAAAQPLALAAQPAAAAAVIATPAFVQANSAVPQTNQTTVTVKYNQAQSVGDTNILAIGWNNSTSNIVSVTDSAGNVYAAAVPTARGTGLSQAIYYAKNIKASAAGANTVTVTFNTATPYVDVRATEYSGLDTTGPLDVGTSASGTGATANSGNVTTTAPGLIFGAGMTTGGYKTAGTGFTARAITNPDLDIAEDRNTTAAGAYGATATLLGSSSWVMQVATFKAATSAPDTTAPTVTVAAPSGTLTGTVTITATASDNVGVSGVRFLVDSNQIGTEDTTSPYNQTLDTTALSNGTHSVTAVARDTAGNSATSAAVTITVANTPPDSTAPTVTITDPPGGVVSGTFTVAANAADNVGVSGVRFLVDGAQIGAEDTTAPYSTTLNTIPLSNGAHTLTAVARDAAGNTATSAPVSITVNNVDTSAPSVTLTGPTGTVSGTVTLSANANDNAGIASVRFLVDGNTIGTPDTTSPYSQSWNTATAANGTHTLTAVATDVNGLSTTSAPVNVTVNNAAAAPPAFKQVNTAVPQTNQTTVTVKYNQAQSVGDTNILAIGWNNSTSNIVSVTDSAGNVYAAAVPTARGTGLSQAIYYAKNIKASAAGANTVTVTFNTATPYVDVRATEYSGLDTTGPLDVGTSASGTGATANSGNVTTTAPGLIFGAGMTSGGFSSAGTGFTTRVITNPDADIALDRIVTASGVYNATATQSGSAAWVMQVATFKAAAVATGDTVAPTVSVSAPTGTLTGVVTVTATASDNVGVSGVRFLVDSNQIGTEDTTSPYSQTLDTTTLSNGTHTLTAIARDAAGNAATSAPVSITVNNASTGQFENEVLATGLDLPTAMKFLPDGRMLVAELGGKIKVLSAPYTQASATPFLQLTNVGNANDGVVAQQGIYDFVLDPDFTNNHFYYVTYTAKTPNRDRLSRFTANADLTGTVAGSEKILYEDPQNADTEHHGGAVFFGGDGKIYMTTGDHFNADNSQDLTTPRGKVLRFNPDGTVPTDNPFYDGAGPNYDAIWAYGLRNPYRATYDPTTNRILIGDVGGNVASTAIEELDVGVRGANYGWANVEGPSTNPAYTNPIFYYAHNGRDAAITGGFVYTGAEFPSAYQGSYFYADYAQNTIKRLTFDAAGNVTGNLNFEPADGTPDGPTGDVVYLTQGPEGALYYIDLGVSDTTGQSGVSKIHRISFTGANQPPVAVASASPSSGPVPLTVNFSSAGSSDPEGQPLSYAWNFGDSTTSTLANPSHTYSVAGPYTVRLTVSDGVNSTISAPVSVTAGNRPTPTIVGPADGTTFVANQVISYSGTATDIEDGNLPASAYTWQVDLLHEGHVHPGAPIVGVTGGTLTIPTSGHDFSGNVRYRITLTVTDSSGLQSATSVTIYPQKVNLTLNSATTGAQLYIDGIAHTSPFTYDDLIGFQNTVSAPDQTINGVSYKFVSWSDGGAQTHVITVPNADQSLSATFTAVATTTPAVQQANSAVPQTNQSTVTVAYTGAQSAGNTNILAIGWNDATSNITSVTDSAGNVYQAAVATARGAGLSQAIYYAKNIKPATAGTNTVTVTFSAPAPYVDLRATEYSGLDAASPFDVGTSASGVGGTADSGAVTATAAGLVFGAGMTTGGYTGAGTGLTARVITNPDQDIVEDRIVSAAGTYNASAPLIGSAAWLMQVATFKAATIAT